MSWETALYLAGYLDGLYARGPRVQSLADRMDELTIPIPECGCHVWIGCLDSWGYGSVSVDGRMRSAHLVALELVGRPRPKGMQADHKCQLECCVNPDHLEYVTQSVNLQRRKKSLSGQRTR